MGRRALPKVDPTLDLTGWLLTDADVPVPWSSCALFGRQARLEIEVGSGKGMFLTHATATQPTCDFLGIEIARKYAHFAAAQLVANHRTNGKVLQDDAMRFFRDVLPSNSVGAVHVYFPDPWWKQRHRKRRVMQSSFVRDIERVLHPGGALHFWTDVEEYFRSTLKLLGQATQLVGPATPNVTPSEHDLDYRTHFERRMRLHELPIYRAEYRKSITDQVSPADQVS
jgi:tRNA (guanine-N7-)-methyltransferase